MNNDLAFYLHVMIASVIGAMIVPFALPVIGVDSVHTTGCFVTLVVCAIVTLVLAIKER